MLLFKNMLAVLIMGLLMGCFAPPKPVLTDQDWMQLNDMMATQIDEGTISKEEAQEKLDAISESTMTEEEYAIWKEDMTMALKDVVLAPVLSALPEPLEQSTKDWTDDLMKYLMLALGGTGAIGLGEVTRRKLKNSPPGKVFGPMNPS